MVTGMDLTADIILAAGGSELVEAGLEAGRCTKAVCEHPDRRRGPGPGQDWEYRGQEFSKKGWPPSRPERFVIYGTVGKQHHSGGRKVGPGLFKKFYV